MEIRQSKNSNFVVAVLTEMKIAIKLYPLEDRFRVWHLRYDMTGQQ
jgi:hypothetical protein